MVTRTESETSSHLYSFYANPTHCEISLRKYLHDQQETRQYLWPVELGQVEKLEKCHVKLVTSILIRGETLILLSTFCVGRFLPLWPQLDENINVILNTT